MINEQKIKEKQPDAVDKIKRLYFTLQANSKVETVMVITFKKTKRTIEQRKKGKKIEEKNKNFNTEQNVTPGAFDHKHFK